MTLSYPESFYSKVFTQDLQMLSEKTLYVAEYFQVPFCTFSKDSKDGQKGDKH